ncbi:hypothetical protein D3C87_1750270 [compost metagenome]
MPFVEAGGRDKHATVAHRGAKRCLFDRRLGAGIDQKRKIPGVLDPAGREPPANEKGLALRQVASRPGAVCGDHDDNRLGRRNVEARRKVIAFQQAEQLHQFFRRHRQRKTSAHDIDVALHVGWVNATETI